MFQKEKSELSLRILRDAIIHYFPHFAESNEENLIESEIFGQWQKWRSMNTHRALHLKMALSDIYK